MRLDEIPDDLGDRGVGTRFKLVFRKYCVAHHPPLNPEATWDSLWEAADRHYPDEGDTTIAARIIDVVLKKIDPPQPPDRTSGRRRRHA